jgi:FkbM family methyltransferase
VIRQIEGKIHAVKTAVTQAQHFKNWVPVFNAYRKHQQLPPLLHRSGLVLNHGSSDDPWALFEEIFVQRCYTRQMFYQPKVDDAILDFGANIGFFSLHIQSLAKGARVHCFEPSSTTRARLTKNVMENQFAENIKIYPFAVSAEAGTAVLHHPQSAGDSTLVKGSYANTQDEVIECITFRQALKRTSENRIALLKVDVEGAECEIFSAMSKEDFSCIDKIVLEYHEKIRPGCRALLLDYLKPHYRHFNVLPIGKGDAIGIIEAF